jgi:hypothetical protein
MAISERSQFKAYIEDPTGKAFNHFNHKGIYYIIAEQNAEFRLNIMCTNPSHNRYALRLNIDGNDVLSGIKTIKTTTLIHGFKKGESTYSCFKFDYPPKSFLEEKHTYHGTIKIDFYNTTEQMISKRRVKRFQKNNHIPVYATSKNTECLSVVEGNEVTVDNPMHDKLMRNSKLVCDFNHCIDTLVIKYLEFEACLIKKMVIFFNSSLILINSNT